MARRFVVEGSQGDGSLKPVASPVDTFMTPELRLPEMQNILDLAPLSRSFGGLSEAIIKGAAESAYKTGGKAFAEMTAQDKALLATGDKKTAGEKLAAMARAKEVPEWAIPHFYKGLNELAAEDLMGRYDLALKEKLEEYATVRDENGFLVPDPPKSAGEVADEVWEQFKGSPILSNFYGSQVAARAKANIDSNWDTAATLERAKALKAEQLKAHENKFGTQLENYALAGKQDQTAIQETIKLARENGMPDIQQVVFGAAKDRATAIANKALLTDDAAERERLFDLAYSILDSVDDIQFGANKLGDNADFMAQISSAFVAIEELRDRADSRQKRKRTEDYTAQAWEIVDAVLPTLGDKKNDPEAMLPALQQEGAKRGLKAEQLTTLMEVGTQYIKNNNLSKFSDDERFNGFMSDIFSGKIADSSALNDVISVGLQTKTLSGDQASQLYSTFRSVEAGRAAAAKEAAEVGGASSVASMNEFLASLKDQGISSTLPAEQFQSSLLRFGQATQAANKLAADQQGSAKAAAKAAFEKEIATIQADASAQESAANTKLFEAAISGTVLNSVEESKLRGRISRTSLDRINNVRSFVSNPTAFLSEWDAALSSDMSSVASSIPSTTERAAAVNEMNDTITSVGRAAFIKAHKEGIAFPEQYAVAEIRKVLAESRNINIKDVFGVKVQVTDKQQEATFEANAVSAAKATAQLTDSLSPMLFVSDSDRRDVVAALGDQFKYPLFATGKDQAEQDAKIAEIVGGQMIKDYRLYRAVPQTTVAGAGAIPVAYTVTALPPVPSKSREDAFIRIRNEVAGAAPVSGQARSTLATSLGLAFGLRSDEIISGKISAGEMTGTSINMDTLRQNPMMVFAFQDFLETYGFSKEEGIGPVLHSGTEEVEAAITGVMRSLKLDPANKEQRAQFVLIQVQLATARYKQL